MAQRSVAVRSPVLAPVLALVVAVLVTAPLASGCATVQPWQRETLSRRCMRLTPDPEGQQFQVHVFENREGSVGGSGVSGGGCGCN